jgi:hypothetical protein
MTTYVGFAATDMLVNPLAARTEDVDTDTAKVLLSEGYRSRCFQRSVAEVERFKNLFDIELKIVRYRSRFMKTGDRFLEIIPNGDTFAFKLYSL